MPFPTEIRQPLPKYLIDCQKPPVVRVLWEAPDKNWDIKKNFFSISLIFFLKLDCLFKKSCSENISDLWFNIKRQDMSPLYHKIPLEELYYLEPLGCTVVHGNTHSLELAKKCTAWTV